MHWKRVMTVARREWREVREHRLMLLSMSALPVIMTLVPLVIIAITLSVKGNANTADLRKVIIDLPEDYTVQQALVTLVVRNWMAMFLILPVFVPVVLAAHGIVGEKERRTLEPLLASPLSTGELLLGKTIAALVPGLIITWSAFLVFATGVDVLAWPHFSGLVLPDANWLVSMLFLGPALALLGNGLCVLVSSRVTDARLAQQLAGTAVLPLLILLIAQMARGVAFGPVFYAVSAVVVLAIDVGLYALAIRLFDRERLITSVR